MKNKYPPTIDHTPLPNKEDDKFYQEFKYTEAFIHNKRLAYTYLFVSVVLFALLIGTNTLNYLKISTQEASQTLNNDLILNLEATGQDWLINKYEDTYYIGVNDDLYEAPNLIEVINQFNQ